MYHFVISPDLNVELKSVNLYPGISMSFYNEKRKADHLMS